MATSSVVTAETLISLKINHDGSSKRFKLPLRDLGVTSLEVKLRGLLAIPIGTDAVIERYSDSAAAYVVLDPANLGAYKQLYRAAKAKQKLKFRVTTKEPAADKEDKGPKPATVEDEAEPEVKSELETVPEVPPKLIPVKETEDPLISLDGPFPTEPAQAPKPTPSSELLGQYMSLMKQRAMEQSRQYPPIFPERDSEKKQTDAPTTGPTSEHIQAVKAFTTALDTLNKLKAEASCRALPIRTNEPPKCPRTTFAVCCNSCDKTIPDVHYHCSTCDEGDFDLCQACVDKGITCFGDSHWLIKRSIQNNSIVTSTTERIAPKPKVVPAPIPEEPATEAREPAPSYQPPANVDLCALRAPLFEIEVRTCNSCVGDFPESAFVHCVDCDDYDLCKRCFVKNEHGHHPKHSFVAAKEDRPLEPEVSRLLAPGRSQLHNAVCDGCDKPILGVRHKCLDCPDFDYCHKCHKDAADKHPTHRFVPIFEPVESLRSLHIRAASRPTHTGICCDGPNCASMKGCSYIVGDRYKCAVCHDTDFCASCEASPANQHNRTHPLIKFKTPVRNVSVTTTGDQHNGQPMPIMGDRLRASPPTTSSRSTETVHQGSVATNVQTVVDVKPSAPVKADDFQTKMEKNLDQIPEKLAKKFAEKFAERVRQRVGEKLAEQVKEDLAAVFVRDTVEDGTKMAPGRVFEQTWVLRNTGNIAWPAGCAVKFVGGDYMGHVDPNHPASISDVVSSSESTICYADLAPGQEFPFTVLLRAPSRAGRAVSNWRLTTKDGLKFGHRLWCDVVVEKPAELSRATSTTTLDITQDVKVEDTKAAEVKVQEEVKVEEPVKAEVQVEAEGSQMIFPKLEKESPVASIHEEVKAEPSEADNLEEDYEDCAENEDWAEDDESFVTDDEYDILDASDEEFLEGEQKKLLKK